MKSFRSCSALVLGLMVGSVWACDAETNDAEDDSNAAGKGGSAGRGGAQNESGRGGTQNESGRGGSRAAAGGEAGGDDSGASGAAGRPDVVTDGGAGGILSSGGAPNTGGAAGAGGSFIYDEDLCDCTVDDEGAAICSITPDEFHARIPIPSGCDDSVVEIETSECDDGTTRVRWIEDFDQAYLVVSETASGDRVYARAAPYQDVCDTGDRFEILSYGAAPSDSEGCERTEYCCDDDDFCPDRGTAGAGGEAGSGR